MIQYGDDRVDIGDILSVRLYETSTLDDPILEIEYDGTFAQDGFFALFGISDHFQDQQGLVVIDLFQGSVDIARVFTETVIDGERYLHSKDTDIQLIPEPSSTLLIGITGLLFTGRRNRAFSVGTRKHTKAAT